MQKINFISYLKLRVNLDLGMRNKKVTSEIWIYKDEWRYEISCETATWEGNGYKANCQVASDWNRLGLLGDQCLTW